MRSSVFVVVLAAALAVAGCSSERSTPSPSPTTPSPTGTNLTGTWSGDLAVQGTPAQMTWTLTQAGNAVSGNARVGLATGTVLLNGSLSGTLSGQTLTYTISVSPGGIPTQPACSGQLGGNATASANPPLTLAGNYSLVSSTCASPLSSGSFELTKR
jgi:hypothetical protein